MSNPRPTRRPQRRAPATPKIAPPLTPFQRELTTKRRGEISELAFALAAARHGFGIARPYGDSERYDIILDPAHLADALPTEAPPLPAPRRRTSARQAKSHLQRAHWMDLLFTSARPRLIRVQVKSSTQLVDGLYRINAHRRINGRALPYTLNEIDFLAAYIIPEDSWFILPLAHILGQTSLLFRPKKSRLPSPYHPYREAWPLLYQSDGLIFA